jgi:hypothetical protein
VEKVENPAAFFETTPYAKALLFTRIFGPTDMPGKYLDHACADCQAVEAALDVRNRQLCQ